MEEKKKVYVRGCKGRGQEVIDILTGLGATATAFRCDSDALIYFINHDNEIDCTNVCTEKALIIMDNYKEIELPQRQWKDGDILVHDNFPHTYAVFKKFLNNYYFESYFVFGNEDSPSKFYRGSASFDRKLAVRCYHLASAEERREIPKLLYVLLNNLDALRKCLSKKESEE